MNHETHEPHEKAEGAGPVFVCFVSAVDDQTCVLK